MQVPLSAYLILSAFLFTVGVIGVWEALQNHQSVPDRLASHCVSHDAAERIRTRLSLSEGSQGE